MLKTIEAEAIRQVRKPIRPSCSAVLRLPKTNKGDHFNPRLSLTARERGWSLLSGEEVLRKIDGIWFGLPISTNGFANTSIPSLFYATTGTGPPYELSLDTGPLTELVNTVVNTVPFGAAFRGLQWKFILRQYGTAANAQPPIAAEFDLKTGTASCEHFSQATAQINVQIGILDLSTLGFLPPFSLSEVRPRR